MGAGACRRARRGRGLVRDARRPHPRARRSGAQGRPVRRRDDGDRPRLTRARRARRGRRRHDGRADADRAGAADRRAAREVPRRPARRAEARHLSRARTSPSSRSCRPRHARRSSSSRPTRSKMSSPPRSPADAPGVPAGRRRSSAQPPRAPRRRRSSSGAACTHRPSTTPHAGRGAETHACRAARTCTRRSCRRPSPRTSVRESLPRSRSSRRTTVPPVCCAICRIRDASSFSTRVNSAAEYGLSSGNAATWTSSAPWDAVTRPCERSTLQPAGASKRKPAPLSDCGGCCAAPEPPQPARMAPVTSSAAHASRRSEATRKG